MFLHLFLTKCKIYLTLIFADVSINPDRNLSSKGAKIMGDFKPGIFLVLFLIFFALLWIVFVKLGRQQDRYDERQEINRGKAYKSAFATVCIWELLYFIAKTNGIPIPADDGLMAIAGVLTSICVYAVLCIFTDAYFPINRSSNAIIALWIVIGIMNIAVGIWNIADGKMITDGRLNVRASGMLGGIIILIVAIACIVRKIVLKDSETED